MITRENRERIPWEGEFTIRSDPWAGLIASCGSFYPMVQPQDSTQRSAPSLLMVSPPLPLGHNIDYNMAQRVFGGEQKPDVIAGKLETQRRLPSDLDLVSGSSSERSSTAWRPQKKNEKKVGKISVKLAQQRKELANFTKSIFPRIQNVARC